MDSYAIRITPENREIIKNYFSKLDRSFTSNSFNIGALYGISNSNCPNYIPVENAYSEEMLYRIFDKEISTQEFYRRIGKLKSINYEIYY